MFILHDDSGDGNRVPVQSMRYRFSAEQSCSIGDPYTLTGRSCRCYAADTDYGQILSNSQFPSSNTYQNSCSEVLPACRHKSYGHIPSSEGVAMTEEEWNVEFTSTLFWLASYAVTAGQSACLITPSTRNAAPFHSLNLFGF